MSRPRLDAEQKKVSFSLAFSPNLIARSRSLWKNGSASTLRLQPSWQP